MTEKWAQECADAAAHYIVAGLNPIPLRPRDKRPAINSWKRFQSGRMIETHEQDQLDAYLWGWWGEGDRGIGIVTGETCGLVVVDVDSPEARRVVEDFMPRLAGHDRGGDGEGFPPVVRPPRRTADQPGSSWRSGAGPAR